VSARGERRRRAFTLIETAVVVAIVGVMAALASTAYDSYIERVRVIRAVIEIKNMATELESYLAVGGALPPTLVDAGFAGPKDPWGHPYAYLPLAGRKLPGVSAPPPGAGGGKPADAGSGGGGGPEGQPRKDRFLVPINTDFDLYSVGRDGESLPPLGAAKSRDDVVRAANGAFIGLASRF
jgi:general secretion pathway protein G